MTHDKRPLVLHVVYRFDTGGLENGVVNLINHMPAQAYRHAVLALTEVTEFKRRVERPDVQFYSLNKAPGHGFWLYPKLYKLFKQLRPAVVHTRNLAALEAQLPAWAAGVPVRIHGEHGRDVSDLDGSNLKLQGVRRLYRPFVHHYVALSQDLASYLQKAVRVPASRLTLACNGVDTAKFFPSGELASALPGCPFDPSRHFLIGTVGRMAQVKDQLSLAKAFVLALRMAPELEHGLRLVMVGDGPLRSKAQAILEEAGCSNLAWLPGERGDVPQIMRALHLYVLPSLAEGISNTILEAMASGLPVLATEVGGNSELVVTQQTGLLVPAASPEQMAQHIVQLARNPALARTMGRSGKLRVDEKFSLPVMIKTYQDLYDQQLSQRRGRPAPTPPDAASTNQGQS